MTEADAPGRPAPGVRVASRVEARREAIRELLRTEAIAGPRELADRLAAEGHEVGPADLRADLRRLGAIRVEGPDGPRLAVAVDGAAAVGGSGGPTPAAGRPDPLGQLTGDPDWPLQAVVVAVVLVFVLAGLVAWLVAP